jgi:aminoglycoside 6'-N-acetyltransferase I
MHIVDLASTDHAQRQRAAALLVDLLPEGWPTLDDALAEVSAAAAPARIARAALEGADLVGWIGGLEMYPGNVWELHPLVVERARQGVGIGRALVGDLESRVKVRGAHTLLVGSADERGATTPGGVDLYPDVLAHLGALRDRAGHPFGFYERLGFRVVGVVPDANGFGKPDIRACGARSARASIWLAKRVVAPAR